VIIKKFCLIILFCSILFSGGCEKESPVRHNRIIIGLSSDIASPNPLFSFSVDEGSIAELLYLSLINFTWNEEKGNINPEPMLAQKWNWADDSSSITFNLRNDVYWSDGVKVSAYDVVFSFDVYSDPDVNSKLFETFTDFYTDSENHIDLEKTFEVIDSFNVKINFLPNSTPTLPEIVLHVIPKHIFENVPRKNIETSEENFKPVTNGPFILANWDKNQSIRLKSNKNSFLYNPDVVDELILKIVPDYNSRLTQLRKKEIDLAELIKTEDIKELQKENHLQIVSQKGREYDYIGWSNIDNELYNSTGEIKPHKLFGSTAVRKALTYAINREEILDEYLLGYGQLAISPVSPIFKEAVYPGLNPYEYNVNMSKKLLETEGWKDKNNDGVLEKNGAEFKFTLYIPSGNPRRSYTATVIKNNLRQVGIEVNIETIELGVLIDYLYEKNMDAWLIGWYVPIPIDLKISWYSDLQRTPYNFAGYQSRKAAEILDKISVETDEEKINDLYKEFQKIIYEDQPVTFLYWVDNIVAYNKKIENIDVNPLGAIHHCWKWTVTEQ
jgi:peptide/nickel transport system substrate-binding protein